MLYEIKGVPLFLPEAYCHRPVKGFGSDLDIAREVFRLIFVFFFPAMSRVEVKKSNRKKPLGRK